MDPLARAVAVGLCMALGSAVQSSCGLGLALVAMPGLIFLEPRMMPGPMLSSSLLLSILVVRREWGSVDWRGLKWALGGRGIGTLAAVAALPLLQGHRMGAFLGALLLVAVLLTAQRRWILEPNPGTLSLAGVLSGVMGTTAAVGGPAIGLVYHGSDMARLRSTLAAFFIVGTILSLIALRLTGHFGRDELYLSAVAIPAVLIGWGLGRVIRSTVPASALRRGVLLLAAAGGIIALIRG